MIKNLDGVRETVDYEDFPNLRLYDNVEFEEYPIHWHPAIEIIMPIHRMYQVEISDRQYHLKESDILVIAPGTLHHLLPAEGERLILLVDSSSFRLTSDYDSIISFIQPALLITKETQPAIYERCHQLLSHSLKTYFGTNPFKSIDIFSDLFKLLSLIGQSFTIKNQMFDSTTILKQQEYIKKFMDLCEYINAHCNEEISLDAAAEMIGFSKYHFTRLFKDFTGNTFYKYLNTCRISRAETLLLDPEISITEVAMRSGFNSISSFIRMFKIVKGCTPTDFRKMRRSD